MYASMMHPNGRPFSCDDVRQIIFDQVLRGSQRPPGREDTESLTFSLNLVAGAYQFAKKYASARPQAAKVQGALETLVEFFDERREACSGLRQASRVVFAERALYNKFWDLITALEQHDFELDMDAVQLMPDYNKGWHDIADLVAQTFRAAMRSNNPNKVLGRRSNDGPVPRFVAAVLPPSPAGNPRH
jgi:hypothetical protein